MQNQWCETRTTPNQSGTKWFCGIVLAGLLSLGGLSWATPFSDTEIQQILTHLQSEPKEAKHTRSFLTQNGLSLFQLNQLYTCQDLMAEGSPRSFIVRTLQAFPEDLQQALRQAVIDDQKGFKPTLYQPTTFVDLKLPTSLSAESSSQVAETFHQVVEQLRVWRLFDTPGFIMWLNEASWSENQLTFKASVDRPDAEDIEFHVSEFALHRNEKAEDVVAEMMASALQFRHIMTSRRRWEGEMLQVEQSYKRLLQKIKQNTGFKGLIKPEEYLEAQTLLPQLSIRRAPNERRPEYLGRILSASYRAKDWAIQWSNRQIERDMPRVKRIEPLFRTQPWFDNQGPKPLTVFDYL